MSLALWERTVKMNNLIAPLRATETKVSISMDDLVELRSELRAQLEDLKRIITDQYSERDAYYVLFPLTAYCDEMIKKTVLDAAQLEWPPLQQELYQVDDAGDLFFELLDDSLSKPETLFLVYEMYYFCLKDGFCGRFTGNPNRIGDYLEKLAKRIRLQPIAEINPTPPIRLKRGYFRIPTYLYYCSAGLLLILVYVFLINLASTWHPLE